MTADQEDEVEDFVDVDVVEVAVADAVAREALKTRATAASNGWVARDAKSPVAAAILSSCHLLCFGAITNKSSS